VPFDVDLEEIDSPDSLRKTVLIHRLHLDHFGLVHFDAAVRQFLPGERSEIGRLGVIEEFHPAGGFPQSELVYEHTGAICHGVAQESKRLDARFEAMHLHLAIPQAVERHMQELSDVGSHVENAKGHVAAAFTAGAFHDPVEDRPLARNLRVDAASDALHELPRDHRFVQQILAERVRGEPGKISEYGS
jgi:hypothetical protein